MRCRVWLACRVLACRVVCWRVAPAPTHTQKPTTEPCLSHATSVSATRSSARERNMCAPVRSARKEGARPCTSGPCSGYASAQQRATLSTSAAVAGRRVQRNGLLRARARRLARRRTTVAPPQTRPVESRLGVGIGCRRTSSRRKPKVVTASKQQQVLQPGRRMDLAGDFRWKLRRYHLSRSDGTRAHG